MGIMSDLIANNKAYIKRDKYIYAGSLIIGSKEIKLPFRMDAEHTAEILELPIQKVYHLFRVKKIKAEKQCGMWNVHLDDVLEYLKANNKI